MRSSRTGFRLNPLPHTPHIPTKILSRYFIQVSLFHIMHLLQAGVNLVYIRDLLGHADISTTEIYARADEKMKRKALMEAYSSPSNEELPVWKKDKGLMDWLKSL